jgi:hypothetical protein
VNQYSLSFLYSQVHQSLCEYMIPTHSRQGLESSIKSVSKYIISITMVSIHMFKTMFYITCAFMSYNYAYNHSSKQQQTQSITFPLTTVIVNYKIKLLFFFYCLLGLVVIVSSKTQKSHEETRKKSAYTRRGRRYNSIQRWK